MRTTTQRGVMIFICIAVAAVAGAVEFRGLGDLSGGESRSEAHAVSGDGTVVVGWSKSASGREAFLWTVAGGMQSIGELAGGAFDSVAYGISDDGKCVVGSSESVHGKEAFRWTVSEGIQGLGDFSGGKFHSEAYAVSADGSAIVGIGTSQTDVEPFRWTESGGVIALGHLSNGSFSTASGVSSDGSVVVGRSAGHAFRWDDVNGMIALEHLQSGTFAHGADVSADASVVVGSDITVHAQQAVIWDTDGTATTLGAWAHASAVSGDGRVVVGTEMPNGEFHARRAWIWATETGRRNLEDVLERDAGMDLLGWRLTEATDVSADGLTVVGIGINPQGQTEAWMAVLPEPSTIALLLGAMGVLLRRKGRFPRF